MMSPPQSTSKAPRPRANESHTLKSVQKKFGIDPRRVGISHLSWQIISDPSHEDSAVGAKKNYLRVRTADKAYGYFDEAVMNRTNFIGISNDLFESERTSYYFRPLENGV